MERSTLAQSVLWQLGPALNVVRQRAWPCQWPRAPAVRQCMSYGMSPKAHAVLAGGVSHSGLRPTPSVHHPQAQFNDWN